MKVGDYIRTDDGLIGKVVSEQHEYKDSIGCDIDFGNNDVFNEYEMCQRIIKSSPNIIDLIEVGDIIITKHPAFNKEWLEKINNKEMMKIRKKIIEEGSLILISIVTKEQFESMEYKIGE